MSSGKYTVGKAKPYTTSDNQTLWEFVARITVKIDGKSLSNTRSKKGFQTQDEAEKFGYKKLVPMWQGEEAAKLIAGSTWKHFCEDWIDALYKGKGLPHPVEITTIEDHCANLRLYTRDFNSRPIEDIEIYDIRLITQQMEADGKSISRRKAVVSTIRAVYKWGFDNRKFKRIKTNPTEGIKFTKRDLQQSNEPPVLSENEQIKLLQTAKMQNHEYYWLWALLCLTGLRSGEAFACRWDDVDFTHKLLTIDESWNKRKNKFKSTKTGVWRKVPMNNQLMSLLQELKAMNHDPEFILPRIESWRRGESAKVLKSFCNEIGIRECTTHGLRASFTVNLLQKRTPITTVMKILGWTDVTTMTCYTRLAGVDVEGSTDTIEVLPSFSSDMTKPLFQDDKCCPKLSNELSA